MLDGLDLSLNFMVLKRSGSKTSKNKIGVKFAWKPATVLSFEFNEHQTSRLKSNFNCCNQTNKSNL